MPAEIWVDLRFQNANAASLRLTAFVDLILIAESVDQPWNCSSSVEPTRARVEASPALMTVLTKSK